MTKLDLDNRLSSINKELNAQKLELQNKKISEVSKKNAYLNLVATNTIYKVRNYRNVILDLKMQRQKYDRIKFEDMTEEQFSKREKIDNDIRLANEKIKQLHEDEAMEKKKFIMSHSEAIRKIDDEIRELNVRYQEIKKAVYNEYNATKDIVEIQITE